MQKKWLIVTAGVMGVLFCGGVAAIVVIIYPLEDENKPKFDLIQNGVHWLGPFVIFVAAALFLLIGWVLRQSDQRNTSPRRLMFQMVGGVGILGALVFFASAFAEYHEASKLLAEYRYSTVEGVVSSFIPMPPGGHAVESFRINEVVFSYGSGWGSTYFNSEWNGGAIHDGVHARITYRGADILNVEVK